MIRKMLLLVGAAMALAAFSASAAQANQWYTDEIGSSFLLDSSTFTGDHVSLEGELATTNKAGTFVTGPCDVTAEAILWNKEGQATGEVNNIQIFTPCETSVPGCEVNEAGPTAEFPWHIDVNDDALSITDVAFAKVYGDGCTGIGLPPGVPIGGQGTVTGTFNTTTHCIDFEKSGHLLSAIGPIFLDGSLCTEGQNTLTLK